MKSGLTPSPSNQLSQDSPAGVRIRLRPMATTSTRFTSSGRATDFGRRTAWLRLLLKMAPCSTMGSLGYVNGIYHLGDDVQRYRRGVVCQVSRSFDPACA